MIGLQSSADSHENLIKKRYDQIRQQIEDKQQSAEQQQSSFERTVNYTDFRVIESLRGMMDRFRFCI